MDINELLKGVDCSCGKHHTCPIESVYIEKGAILRLSELCKSYSCALIVADENTYSVAGEMTVDALADKDIEKVIFSGKTVLIPNEESIEAVQNKMDKAEVIIGIGSGVIQDLCKYVSFFSKIPYMVVATAPSMDGYASSGAAMILKGMKETVPAGLPKAILADTEVLKNAPIEMIKAGYGDIIGKTTALMDWQLSRIINKEYFCQYIYDVTNKMVQDIAPLNQKLLNRDEESVKKLTEALIIVGIMMSFATNSRPASGSEHHLSHFFEITGIVKNEPYLPHGIDVGCSTAVILMLCDKILSCKSIDYSSPQSRQEYEKEMERVYGSVSRGCIALQDKMGRYNQDRIAIYKENAKEIEQVLKSLPDAEDVVHALSLVGIDIWDYFKLYGKEKIEDAVKYAKDLKDRYTVLWIYYDIFGRWENDNL